MNFRNINRYCFTSCYLLVRSIDRISEVVTVNKHSYIGILTGGMLAAYFVNWSKVKFYHWKCSLQFSGEFYCLEINIQTTTVPVSLQTQLV